MFIQSNKTEPLPALFFYPMVALCAVIVVAVNAIKAVGRQFSEPDSYLRQYDAYLTEKTISYGNDLIEYGFSFFTQKKVEVVSQKALEIGLKEPIAFSVEDAVKKIKNKARQSALSYMIGDQFTIEKKEAMAEKVSGEVEKIAKWAFRQEKPRRFSEWSDNEFKEDVLQGVAFRHMNVHLKAFLASLKCQDCYPRIPKSKDEQLFLLEPKGGSLKIQEDLSVVSLGGSTSTKIPSWDGFVSAESSSRSSIDTI